MIDDYDQMWRSGGTKGRFCSDSEDPRLIVAAVERNPCMIGICSTMCQSDKISMAEGRDDNARRLNDQCVLRGDIR